MILLDIPFDGYSKLLFKTIFFLQGNDSKTQNDNSGTSRFSQWFAIKEPANISKPSTQETQGNKRLKSINMYVFKTRLNINERGSK